MSEKLYFITVLVFQDARYNTLWYTSDEDGFVLDENKIRVFASESDAEEFAYKNNLELDSEKVEIICSESVLSDVNKIDCNLLLTFWNIVTDAAKTLNIEFIGNSRDECTEGIYNKLFYGSNLPAVKKDGGDYIPCWNRKEKKLIMRIVKDGLEILQKNLQC